MLIHNIKQNYVLILLAHTHKTTLIVVLPQEYRHLYQTSGKTIYSYINSMIEMLTSVRELTL